MMGTDMVLDQRKTQLNITHIQEGISIKKAAPCGMITRVMSGHNGGTIVELAKKYHRTIKQMIYLTYPTTHKRAKDNRLLLYEVKG